MSQNTIGFIQSNEPLFLPSGSVRALLAISVTLVTLILIFQEHPLELFKDLAEVEITVIALYFGKRSTSGKNKKGEESEIQSKRFLFFDSEKPLGLKAGLVRSTLTILVVGMGILYFTREADISQWQWLIPIFTTLAGYWGGKFVNYLWTWILHIKDKDQKMILTHLKALSILVSTILAGISYILLLPDATSEPSILGYTFGSVIGIFIGLYFGAKGGYKK